MQESQKASANKFRTDFKWDTALTYSRQEWILRRLKDIIFKRPLPDNMDTMELKSYTKPLFELKWLQGVIEAKNIPLAAIEVNHDWFYEILGRCLEECDPPKSKRFITKAFSALKLIMREQIKYLRKSCSTGMSTQMNDDVWVNGLANQPSLERRVLHRFMLWDELIRSLHTIHDRRKDPNNPGGSPGHYREYTIEGVQMIVFTQCVLLKTSGVWYLAPRACLLLMHNKLSEFFSTMFISRVTEGVVHRTGFCEDVLYPWLRECLKILRTRRGYSYHLFKLFDGLLVARVILNEESWDNPDFWLTNIKAVSDDNELRYQWEGSNLDELSQRMSPDELIDIIGTCKLFGFPVIDYRKGAHVTYEATHAEVNIDAEEIARVCNYTKLKLCESFFAQHGKWPNISVADEAPDRLKMAFARGLWFKDERLGSHLPQITFNDFAWVTLEKNREFDDLISHAELLKDKALCPTRGQLELSILGKKKVRLSDKRTLLHYLVTRDIHEHCSELLNQIKIGDTLPLDYLIIKLTAKEKELKEEGRYFGQTTYENRYRMICQNYNTKCVVGKYLRVSTLSYSELDTIKRIYSLQQLARAHPGSKIFIYTLDATKWNNRMRHEFVSAFGSIILDRWLGVQVYCNSQMYYHNSLILLPTSSETWFWEGQEGGIEGLNQDEWGAAWAMGVSCFMDREGYNFQAMAKGDDLRLVIVVPDHVIESLADGERTFVNDLKIRIADQVRKLGHEQKFNETYASCVLFSWSKSHWLRGIKLPSMIKKACKIDGYANAIYPGVREMIGSCMACAHATCNECDNHIGPYSLGLFRSMLHILGTTLEEINDRLLALFFLWPSPLGGPPVPPLVAYLQRSESDLLTYGLSLLFDIMKHEGPLQTLAAKIFTCKLSKKFSTEQILMDPYSIPIDKPPSPRGFLEQSIIEGLRKITKNVHMKEVLRANSKIRRRQFCDSVFELNPFHAKVAADLYDCSPNKLIDDFVSKFESGKSIFEFLVISLGKKRAMSSLRRTHQAEIRELEYWKCILQEPCGNRFFGIDTLTDIISTVDVGHTGPCPTKIAHSLREKAWGKPILGITYPSLCDQVIIMTRAEGQLLSMGIVPDFAENHFTLTTREPVTYAAPSSPRRYSCGDALPFVGVETSSGLSDTFVRIEKSSPALKCIDRLLKLHAFTKRAGSSLKPTIQKLLACYTTLDLNALDPFIPSQVHGTGTHRLRAHGFRESITPNSSSNKFSCCTFETDTHHRIRSDTADYTINFMAVMCYCVEMASWPGQSIDWKPYPAQYWSTVSLCDICYQEVPPERYELKANIDEYAISKDNPLVYISSSEEKLLKQQIIDKINQALRTETVNVAAAVTSDKARSLITELFITDLETRSRLVNTFRIGGLDETSREISEVIYHLPSIGWSISTIRRLDMFDLIKCCLTKIGLWVPHVMMRIDIDLLASWAARVPASKLPFVELMRSLMKSGMITRFLQAVIDLVDEYPSVMCDSNPVKASRWVVKVLIPELDTHFADLIGGKTDIVMVINHGADREVTLSRIQHNWRVYWWWIVSTAVSHNEVTGMKLGKSGTAEMLTLILMMHFISHFPVITHLPNDIASLEFTITTQDVLELLSTLSLDYASLTDGCKMILSRSSHDKNLEYMADFESDVEECVDLVVEEINDFVTQRGLKMVFEVVVKDQLVEIVADDYQMADLEEGYMGNHLATRRLIRLEETNPSLGICLSDSILSSVNPITLPPEIFQWPIPNPSHEEADLNSSDLVRFHGSTVTSITKLVEIIDQLKIRFPTRISILSVGEGQGGWLAYLLTTCDDSRGVINDRVTSGRSASSYVPMELMAFQVLQRCQYSFNTHEPNDFTTKECQSSLKVKVQRFLGGKVHLITNDAEKADDTHYFAILDSLLTICYQNLRDGGMLISKFYLTPDVMNLVGLSRLVRCFNSTYLLRLLSSRATSSECYIVCQGFSMSKVQTSRLDSGVISISWVSKIRHFWLQSMANRPLFTIPIELGAFMDVLCSRDELEYMPVFPPRWIDEKCSMARGNYFFSIDPDEGIKGLLIELQRLYNSRMDLIEGTRIPRVNMDRSLAMRIHTWHELYTCVGLTVSLTDLPTTYLPSTYQIRRWYGTMLGIWEECIAKCFPPRLAQGLQIAFAGNTQCQYGAMVIKPRASFRGLISGCLRTVGLFNYLKLKETKTLNYDV